MRDSAKQCSDLPEPRGSSVVRISGNFLLSKPILKKSARRSLKLHGAFVLEADCIFTQQGYGGVLGLKVVCPGGRQVLRITVDRATVGC